MFYHLFSAPKKKFARFGINKRSFTLNDKLETFSLAFSFQKKKKKHNRVYDEN